MKEDGDPPRLLPHLVPRSSLIPSQGRAAGCIEARIAGGRPAARAGDAVEGIRQEWHRIAPGTLRGCGVDRLDVPGGPDIRAGPVTPLAHGRGSVPVYSNRLPLRGKLGGSGSRTR